MFLILIASGRTSLRRLLGPRSARKFDAGLGRARVLTAAVLLFACGNVLHGQDGPGNAAGDGVAGMIAAHDRALIEALTRYLKQHPNADDREQGYLTIFETAIKHDWFAENADSAREYLSREPDGAIEPLARIVVTMAHARERRFSDALAAYGELLRGLDGPEQGGFARSFAAQLAGEATSAGEHAVAQRVYALLTEKFGRDPSIQEEVEGELVRLALVGAAAPEVRFRDAEGRERRLSELRGKVVVIDFWATDCVPWVKDLTELQAVYGGLQTHGVEFVSVSLDESEAVARDALRARKVEWIAVHHATCGDDWVAAFKIRRLPARVVIDRSGIVRRLDVRAIELATVVKALVDAAETGRQ